MRRFRNCAAYQLFVFFAVWWPAFAFGAADGEWAEWSEWISCSVSCGSGVQKRMRACNPPSKPGGKWCEGQYLDNKECNTGVRCPVDGGWSEWSSWARCSVSCGQGTKERYRSCSNPIPEEGGKKCQGANMESTACMGLKECPRDGGWSSWSQWSKCSVTCGSGGSIHRYRACNNPTPVAEGRPCEGNMQETKTCDAPIQCPVNGQWSDWSEWTPCSVSCGQGSQWRHRACDHPPPQHGGADCDRTQSAEVQTISCMAVVQHCPVHGGWSPWSDWRECRSSDCKSTTAPFFSFRHRSCNQPLPRHNGIMCEGSFLEAGRCTQPLNCKVDGGWSEWSQWNCTVSDTVAARTRACINPEPANGGKVCPGEFIKFVERGTRAYDKVCLQVTSDDTDLPDEDSAEDENGAEQGGNAEYEDSYDDVEDEDSVDEEENADDDYEDDSV